MFHTFRYKQGYIHLSYTNGHESVRVCVAPDAYMIQVKSVRAAKCLITKHQKRVSK